MLVGLRRSNAGRDSLSGLERSLAQAATRGFQGIFIDGLAIDVPAEQSLIAQRIAKLQAKVVEIANKWRGKNPTGAEMYPDVRQSWEQAVQMNEVAQGLSANPFTSTTADDKREIETYSLALFEDWPLLKGDAGGAAASAEAAAAGWSTQMLSDTIVDKLVVDMQNPIRWLIRMMTAAAGDRAEIQAPLNAMADTVMNPGKGIAWTLEQLLKGLGLPEWALPVIGVTALVGLSAWAYFTFLAPMTKASHLLAGGK